MAPREGPAAPAFVSSTLCNPVPTANPSLSVLFSLEPSPYSTVRTRWVSETNKKIISCALKQTQSTKACLTCFGRIWPEADRASSGLSHLVKSHASDQSSKQFQLHLPNQTKSNYAPGNSDLLRQQSMAWSRPHTSPEISSSHWFLWMLIHVDSGWFMLIHLHIFMYRFIVIDSDQCD